MDPLSQLHDILLPKPIGWWPLAPGWYGLLFVLILLCVGVFFVFRLWRKKKYLQRVLKKLRTSNFSELSVLLRQLALKRFKEENIAGLQGEAWLTFLDKTGDTTAFSQGVGRVLITAPYQASSVSLKNELIQLLELWVKRNF